MYADTFDYSAHYNEHISYQTLNLIHCKFHSHEGNLPKSFDVTKTSNGQIQ